MQLIFFNGPTNGTWNATILSAQGHVQVNKIPGSENQALDAAIRLFADEQEALPPTRDAVIEFIENYGHFARAESGNDLVLFNWVDGDEVAEAAPEAQGDVTPGETEPAGNDDPPTGTGAEDDEQTTGSVQSGSAQDAQGPESEPVAKTSKRAKK